MKLSDEELLKIARWEPINDEFARIAKSATQSIISQIRKSRIYSAKVFEAGGWSNYVAFLVCYTKELRDDPHTTYLQLNPLAVNLSLCAPVGVIGRIHASYGTDFCCIDRLDLNNLLDPSEIADDLGRFIVNNIVNSPFTLMHPDDVKQLLPPNVVPFEYCLVDEPWDKYFHVLFANSD